VDRAEIAKRWTAGVAALLRAASPPRPSRWAWTADGILAFALTVGTASSVNRGSSVPSIMPPGVPVPLGVPVPPPPPAVQLVHHLGVVHPWQLILVCLTALPLVVRRRYPLAAFWVVIGATLLFHHGAATDDTTVYTFVSCLIAAYSAAMYSPYRDLSVASLVAGAGLIAGFHTSNVPRITPGFVPFLVLFPAGLAANTIHTWKQRMRVLEEEREAATSVAVERERSRIARELHDVVTHNVSVMVIQAGAARKVMDTAPDQSRQALLAVEAGGRAAMAELRHVMGLLTMTADGPDPAATADLAPQPGLGQVAALACRVRDTGVPVELTVTGTPAPLSAGVDLAAYRVVQEALTNAVKHAVGAHVRIAVAYAPDAVRVEVADTGGTSTASVRTGNGRGLIGLRERLAVYGGTLQAGKRPTGGYRVRAVIPVEGP
jgi:signal transduction histidine kinase